MNNTSEYTDSPNIIDLKSVNVKIKSGLQLRQYKNDSAQSKNVFVTYLASEKARQCQKLDFWVVLVWFTSMNPRLFRENILLIFSESIWDTDKPCKIFRILISRALTWAYQIFNSSTADIRYNVCFWEILNFFYFECEALSYKIWVFFQPNIFI